MVSKVSDITISDIADYLRLDEMSLSEQAQLTTFLTVAKSYCSNYTGIPIVASSGEESLDDYPDMVLAIYVLCEDMYDNRALYVEGSAPNKVVESILDMHLRNLL